nr:BhlA/UviB family holin-like peptide [Bacillus pinisoli]
MELWEGAITMDIGVMLFIFISLWSITKTLEKLADKVLEKQEKQNQLLEEISKKLELSNRD